MTELPPKSAILAWMVLPLRRYARFRGRSGRREFWFYSLFLALGYVSIFAVSVAVAVATDDETTIGFAIIGGWALFFLVNLIPGLALTVRRLHDMDLSGVLIAAIFAVLLFFNLIGWIGYLVMMSLPGKPAPNRHGPALGEENTAEIFA